MAATPGSGTQHRRADGKTRSRVRSASRRISRLLAGPLSLAAITAPARAELPPEIGYVFPAGGRAGEAIDVVLGGYDWTSDVEILPHDPGVTLAITGAPTRVLIPDPPHLFGFKARANDRPCPREFPARLALPADLAPGIHRFQVANANGASPPGAFHVSRHPAVREARAGAEVQTLPGLPLVVDGRIARHEEIDRYRFTVPADGPVWVDVVARRVQSALQPQLRVTDAGGAVVLDVADTAGRDLAASFPGRAGETYDLAIHDIDHAGDRAAVYRIELASGPRVLATFPAAVARGGPCRVTVVGVGLAGGSAVLESIERDLAVGAGPVHEETLATPAGPAVLSIPTSAIPERSAGDAAALVAPVAVSGRLEEGAAREVVVALPAGAWRVTARPTCATRPLDLELSILAPDGREVAAADDSAGALDPLATLSVTAPGPHRIVVGGRDLASAAPGPAAWRLVVEPDGESFEPGAALPGLLAVPLGGTAKLPLPILRGGGFAAPVAAEIHGLPAGLTAAAGEIAAGAAEGSIEVTAAGDAGSGATLATLVLTGTAADGRAIRHERPVAVAPTMKPRVKIVPDGLDDVRKVPRGSTFRGGLAIERLEGFQGPVRLEPTAKQQRHRQGMDGVEMIVPAGEAHCEYPVFLPEWMETTRTSRFIVNGAVEVADPAGRVRTLLARQELRLGMLPVGAIMKLTAPAEATARRGATVALPIALSRAAEFRRPGFAGPARVEVAGVQPARAGLGARPPAVGAEPVALPRGDLEVEEGVLHLSVPDDPAAEGIWEVTLRATALEADRHPVVSEARVTLVVE